MDIYTDIDIDTPGVPLPALANQPNHGNSIIFVYRHLYLDIDIRANPYICIYIRGVNLR